MYAGGGELTENIDDVGGAGTAEFASKAIDIFYMRQEFGADGTTEEKPKSKNMLPAILTLIVLACGGGLFVFKKVQEKKKEQEAAKPDPDANYVDDDEDYGYDPEFEDDDADSSVDEDDNEPV